MISMANCTSMVAMALVIKKQMNQRWKEKTSGVGSL